MRRPSKPASWTSSTGEATRTPTRPSRALCSAAGSASRPFPRSGGTASSRPAGRPAGVKARCSIATIRESCSTSLADRKIVRVTTAAPAKAPGPRGKYLLGSLGEFKPDPPRFLAECARRYGPVAGFRLGPSTVFLISEPDLLEEVLVRSVARFRKDVDTRDVSSVLGDGLLTSEGETWKRHRKLLAPPLQPHHIEAMYATSRSSRRRSRISSRTDRSAMWRR